MVCVAKAAAKEGGDGGVEAVSIFMLCPSSSAGLLRRRQSTTATMTHLPYP